MPGNQNGFSIKSTHEIMCVGRSVEELLRQGQYGSVGPWIANRVIIPQHEPTQRAVVLGRFTGTCVMPGDIEDVAQSRELARPTPEDALEFVCQHRQAIMALESESLADPKGKSALVIFPIELTIDTPGRGKYNYILLGATGGELAIHLDFAVPFKSELIFAFTRKQ